MMRYSSFLLVVAFHVTCTGAFVTPANAAKSTALPMGLFDDWRAGGSGKDSLDEEWEKQQEILAERRKPKAERDKYFEKVEQRRQQASAKQKDMWAWQTKSYSKGEDPIDEWKKRRADGTISDLENQYGDPKKIGGIPIPGASFGVGGEFGVGYVHPQFPVTVFPCPPKVSFIQLLVYFRRGKFDNGGRFDLRLPYADQGYVDDDADVMGKISAFFGGGTKKKVATVKPPEEPKTKKGGWPW
jgi:hypothetical protein